jgi:outer membrane protein assembly factor BamB
LLVGFALTTWWLLWAWLMWLVPGRVAMRFGLLAGLVIVAAALLGSVRADGLDGAALPRVAWRFAPENRWPTVEPAVPGGTVSLDESAFASAANYPRFRGPDCLATLSGANLARDWSRSPPKLRWRRPVGAGFGALAVDGGRVFTQEQRGEDECVVCYAREDGRELWVHRDRAHYKMPATGDGPRATPTVDGDRVFTFGATGILNALDRATGRKLWSVDVLADASATAPVHGMVSSPLVVDEHVIVCAGGKNASLVAYDRATGRRVWAAGSDAAGYTSPQLVRLEGVAQIAIVTPQNLAAHDPADGRVLWSTPFANDQQTNCSQPYPAGDDGLFISADYGLGCALVEATRDTGGVWSARKLWSKRTLQTKFSSAVVRGGHAFGLDDGILQCVSLADGRSRWKRGRYGHGQLLLVDDLLVIQAEDGRIALVEADPERFVELATFPALNGRTWNHPALAGRELFCRNDLEAACYELPAKRE